MKHANEFYAYLDANVDILDIAISEFTNSASEAGFSNKEAAAMVAMACEEAALASHALIPDDIAAHREYFREHAAHLHTEAIWVSENDALHETARAARDLDSRAY